MHAFLTTPMVFHGPGALSKLPQMLRRLGSRHPVIVTDLGFVEAGIFGQVAGTLDQETPAFTDVHPEPPDTLVAQCTDFLRSHNSELVIGLGGGSAIDVGKIAAAMLGNTGQVSDYWGVEKVPNPGVPFVAIPTTAGTGSEVRPARRAPGHRPGGRCAGLGYGAGYRSNPPAGVRRQLKAKVVSPFVRCLISRSIRG